MSEPQTGRRTGRITQFLASASPKAFAMYAIGASFSTYFCMYAFRKPFSAAKFADQYVVLPWLQYVLPWLDGDAKIGLKTAFVISQLIGYTLSKLIGIKYCSEVNRSRRALALYGSIVFAHLALLIFAIAPERGQIFALFLNGLPLGMVWGMTVRYLEGRRVSELLLAGLSCSFIVASGAVKSVAVWIMNLGVLEEWMPFVTGLMFLPAFFASVWLLDQIPEPDQLDVRQRSRRESMFHVERSAFMRQFLPGMLLLLVVYFFLTAYRDFRDQFAVELFSDLGYENRPSVFTQTELCIAFGVMIALAALNCVRDNRWGLIGAFCLMAFGSLLMGGGTLLLDAKAIDGFGWMTLTGLGAYLAYVPFGSVLFDRLIASTRVAGTAVFAIYVFDFTGYIGPITLPLFKDLAASDLTRLDFFRNYTYLMSIVGTSLLVASCAYFLVRHVNRVPKVIENDHQQVD